MFLDGAKGWWSQQYRNDEYGIDLVVTRESREHEPVRSFSFDWIPHLEWDNGSQMLEDVVDVGL